MCVHGLVCCLCYISFRSVGVWFFFIQQFYTRSRHPFCTLDAHYFKHRWWFYTQRHEHSFASFQLLLLPFVQCFYVGNVAHWIISLVQNVCVCVWIVVMGGDTDEMAAQPSMYPISSARHFDSIAHSYKRFNTRLTFFSSPTLASHIFQWDDNFYVATQFKLRLGQF